MTLYYITACEWKRNEWWRYAVSATDEAAAIAKFKAGYSCMCFTRIHAKPLCSTSDDVFMEI